MSRARNHGPAPRHRDFALFSPESFRAAFVAPVRFRWVLSHFCMWGPASSSVRGTPAVPAPLAQAVFPPGVVSASLRKSAGRDVHADFGVLTDIFGTSS